MQIILSPRGYLLLSNNLTAKEEKACHKRQILGSGYDPFRRLVHGSVEVSLPVLSPCTRKNARLVNRTGLIRSRVFAPFHPERGTALAVPPGPAPSARGRSSAAGRCT